MLRRLRRVVSAVLDDEIEGISDFDAGELPIATGK